jgi:hypothetical protein
MNLTIKGTYSWNTSINSGLQTMRLELNDARVPTSVISKNYIRFDGDGRYVNTNVKIDGSRADFTMMLAFTLPEVENNDWKHIAFTAGDNRLLLRHLPGTPLNQLTAQIGKFSQDITFDETLPVQAMFARFNHNTSELEVAINGQTPVNVGQIVFDGATGDVRFGSNGNSDNSQPHIGYIGKGVLYSNLLNDQEWFDFWTDISSNPPEDTIKDYMECGEDVECGTPFDCN